MYINYLVPVILQVKSQIHSCISRHLECLRSREVWLLEQVDLIQQLKEETLQQQAQQLYWVRADCTLGSFSVLAQLQIFSLEFVLILSYRNSALYLSLGAVRT